MTSNLFAKPYHYISEKQYFLVGSSIVRLAVGIHIMFTYLVYYFQRHDVWGIHSFVPADSNVHFFSLYTLNNSIVWFETIYILGILVNFLFLIGLKTNFITPINFLFVWSLYNENPFIMDGGNNILFIVLFFLMFANINEYFSVETKQDTNNKSKNIKNIFHNYAIFICLAQVCILYFFSGFFKAQGDMWQHGTALYYILNVDEFTLPSVAPYIINSPLLLFFGAYSSILMQLFFPFLVTNKYTKIITLFGSILFHLGIIFVMGLIQFGLIMIALDLLFITDKEYKKGRVIAKRTLSVIMKRSDTNVSQKTSTEI
ncbi:HTTM domain-containing protein [Pontibacillus yanchengensis]|uniref:HTTM-like domain-containing protein n=1 Tax=Pontibacillus yanchengensis Y32 TaxID=1385514 RepID=A0A0A2TJH4_9BACI|nr:HTTM domain-containing protein [Pontibacillus yanchengensis]KGP74588.1 hypothetical protein N782_00520 [Pontibacillus yanchengensis Y32]